MGFIAWIIMGLIAGTIAKAILKKDGGWVSTLVIGVLGGVVGGWIGSAVSGQGIEGFFSIWSWLLAIGGSVLVLWLYTAVIRRK